MSLMASPSFGNDYLSAESPLSRPRTATNPDNLSYSGPLTSLVDDDLPWSFKTVPTHNQFAHLAQPAQFTPWPQQHAEHSHDRPTTAPAGHDLFSYNINPRSNLESGPQAPFLHSSWSPSHAVQPPALVPSTFMQNTNAGFGSSSVPTGNWQRARMLSLPESSLGIPLPDEPRRDGIPARQAQRPATTSAMLSASIPSPFYHHHQPGQMQHPIYGSSIGRPMPSPFSHDPFPISSPSTAARPNTANARMVSLSHAKMGPSAVLSSRPDTSGSVRPDTSTSFASMTTSGTATLGDVSSQIAEPGQTATAIGADGRVYQFVGVATQQKKRARRRFDEIERMYECSFAGCTKSYGCLNHLNAHVAAQKHGNKRTPAEFKEMRKQWRAKKRAADAKRKAEQAHNLDEDDSPQDQSADEDNDSRPATAASVGYYDYSPSHQPSLFNQNQQLPVLTAFAHTDMHRQDSDPFDYASNFRPATAPMTLNSQAMSNHGNIFQFSAPPMSAPNLTTDFDQIRGHTSPTHPAGIRQMLPYGIHGAAAASQYIPDELGVLGLPARRRGSLPMAGSLHGIAEDDWTDMPRDKHSVAG